MTKQEKLLLMKDRSNKLSNSPKNNKCPGVLRKLNRYIRKMEEELN